VPQTPLPRLSLTGRDFSDIRSQLISAIPTITDRWTDLSQSDVGITLIELMASVGTMLSFYLDHQANEAFLPTTRERRNVINLCKLIAYRLQDVTSSTTVLRFSLQAPLSVRVDVPKYTRVATAVGDVVPFTTTALATIPAGDTEVLVGARQGVLAQESFRTTGTPNQVFSLSASLVDVSSIEVVVDDVVWAEVDSFVAAEGGDRVFVVDVDASGVVSVSFGDGSFGYSPPNATSVNVSVTYLTSMGSAGNVGTGVVTTLLDQISDVLGNPVSLLVTNTQAATGGADQETIEHAQANAPAQLSALFRAMTRDDYVALCTGFPGVGKAVAWGEQEGSSPDYNLFNWVLVSASPAGLTREALLADPTSGLLSDQLKGDLLDFLEGRKCITTRVKLVDPQYVPVDVSVLVYTAPGALATQVKAAVVSALEAFFVPDSTTFGQAVYQSNVVRVVDSLPGVDHSQLMVLRTDSTDPGTQVVTFLSLSRYALPYLRTLVVTTQPATFSPAPASVYPCPAIVPAPHD
jgi:hypothetical protein